MSDLPLVRLVVPDIDDDELTEIQAVLASGYLTQGPKVAEFERLVAALVGTRHAFATTSATTALHLGLVAMGIGPGDEVLVADFTFPASANVVVQQGATPILVDVDPVTFTMDPDDLVRRITVRSRAVIPVHAFGLSADMNPILEIARAHNLLVLEDAACAIAATYYERPVGSMGTAGCFSFHPRKAITTGEGGMITTDDDSLAERISLLRSHGGIRTGNRFRFEAAGFNYRLSDILAAVGVAQLRKLDGILARKRELAAEYDRRLQGLAGVTAPVEPAWRGHVYQSYVLMLDEPIDRDGVIRAMKERGIETTLGTYALHAEPFFERTYGYRPGDLPGSYDSYRRSLTLPLYSSMTESDMDRIVDSLSLALQASASRR
jgi:dTDP-4-amino-4,6-dideoxygalactose transaminase